MKEIKIPEPIGTSEEDSLSTRVIAILSLSLNMVLFIGFIVQTAGVHAFKERIKKTEEAAQQRQEIQQVVEAVLQQQER